MENLFFTYAAEYSGIDRKNRISLYIYTNVDYLSVNFDNIIGNYESLICFKKLEYWSERKSRYLNENTVCIRLPSYSSKE